MRNLCRAPVIALAVLCSIERLPNKNVSLAHTTVHFTANARERSHKFQTNAARSSSSNVAFGTCPEISFVESPTQRIEHRVDFIFGDNQRWTHADCVASD